MQRIARLRLRVGREVSVNIIYKGTVLTSQRLDFVVDEKLIVENKSTENLPRRATPTK